MDRSRRTTNRRIKPMGASSASASASASASTSPPSANHFFLDDRRHPSTSPVMAHTATTPQTAPPVRRGSRPLHQAYAFSTPDPNRSPNLRKRSRTFDNLGMPDDEGDETAGGPSKKGGHSLRKRARVDYSFLEQVDDEVVVPNSTSMPRTKKRRVDVDLEEPNVADPKRLGTAFGVDTPSARKRHPSRKSVEARSYTSGFDEDENDVQDTIEVGVSLPDVDGPLLAESSHAGSSPSPGSSDTKTMQQPLDSYMSHFSNYELPPSSILPPTVDKPPSDQVESAPHVGVASEPVTVPVDPDMQLKQEFTGAQLVQADDQQPLDPPQVIDPALSSSHPSAVDPALVDPMLDNPATNNAGISSSLVSEVQDSSTVVKSELSDDVKDNAPQPSVQLLEEKKLDDQRSTSPVHQPAAESSEAQDAAPAAPAAPSEDVAIAPTAIVEADEIVEEKTASTDGPTQAPSSPPQESLVSASQDEPKESGPDPKPQPQPIEAALETITEAAPKAGEQAASPVPSPPTEERQASVSEVASNMPQEQPQPDTKPEAALVNASPTNPFITKYGTRWAHLSPYMEGEFASYPEKKASSDDETTSEEPASDEKDADKDTNDLEPMVEDNDDAPEAGLPEAPTPALNTPTRGSPAPDSMDPTTFNSPAPAADDADDGDEVESQEVPQIQKHYQYRKIRDAEDYISALHQYEDMSSQDLYEILDVINGSLVEWQNEFNELGQVVDSYENSLRRRAADVKYESRTRNLHQHGLNYQEPEFAVKGYKAKEKETMSETRYLQGQDRIMAAVYGFEYDPHPSKIGKQNPDSQHPGIMTRGRSLRNQPKQTVKASEADEVPGKRQRKPVQLFDPATQDVSRSSTPAPTRGRRRRGANNVDVEETQPSVNGDVDSDAEKTTTPRRRRRGPAAKALVPKIAKDAETPAGSSQESQTQQEPPKVRRRGRGRHSTKKEESMPPQADEEELESVVRQPKRQMVTLKIPRGKNFSEPTSAIEDNGDSRPSTACSDSSSHTIESAYSFRPKRQKRFRDEPEDGEAAAAAAATAVAAQQPPKKRFKRKSGPATMQSVPAAMTNSIPTEDALKSQDDRKVQKIKVVRTAPPPPPESRTGTPSSATGGADGDEPAKDYKSMTKSEKMSASMKSRWANGNMAGAVEKRKATLAAKKAAQAAAEQKAGGGPTSAPKQQKVKVSRKDGQQQAQAPPPPPQQQQQQQPRAHHTHPQQHLHQSPPPAPQQPQPQTDFFAVNQHMHHPMQQQQQQHHHHHQHPPPPQQQQQAHQPHPHMHNPHVHPHPHAHPHPHHRIEPAATGYNHHIPGMGSFHYPSTR